jgi:hypothetical protein
VAEVRFLVLKGFHIFESLYQADDMFANSNLEGVFLEVAGLYYSADLFKRLWLTQVERGCDPCGESHQEIEKSEVVFGRLFEGRKPAELVDRVLR